MPLTPKDAALYAIVSGPLPATIPEVIAAMQHIDSALSDTDGLKWFNRLYLMVTETVDKEASAWKDPAWLTSLDVIFAGFYFRALKNIVDSSAAVPGSWRALMEARERPCIDRIQFALAGMNAHINHDLALALLDTDQKYGGTVPTSDSPQHRDFESVNQLLHNVMPTALRMLAVDVLGVAAQDSGKIGRLLAFWDLCKARDFAWDFAVQLNGLDALQRQTALALQDQMTAVVGRALLTL
ncbi:MAG: DUF5995 family protein [Acidobacteriaceae bacterium]